MLCTQTSFCSLQRMYQVLFQCITGKKPRFLRFSKVAGKIFITTVSKKNVQKKSETDHGRFQQQSTQRLIDRYDHMNVRNKWQDLCLKPIEAEYYSIGN